MTTVVRRPAPFRAAVALLLALPLLGAPALVASPASARSDHRSDVQSDHRAGQRGHHDRVPSHLDLPAGFAPEGIASSGRTAFLGSRTTGDLYRLDTRTGRGEVFSTGPGTPSLGLKVDRGHRLWVAGGSGGDGRVVDTRTGRVLASYSFATPGAGTFVNDVVLTRDAAWFTDSQAAQLYRVPLTGRLGTGFTTVPLTGAWTQVPGQLNANGIAETPDRSALLVVNSAQGALYRVERDGAATPVDLGGYAVTNGDGLLVEGRTLYVVQNRLNTIAVIDLARDGSSGTLRRTITSPDFDVPTTVTRIGCALYLPNARFSTPAATQFWVTRVAR